MQLKTFCVNPLGENTYLLWDEATREALVVDAGMQSEAEMSRFANFLDQRNLRLTMALQTHLHFDHIFGLPFLHRQYHLTPFSHQADVQLYRQMPAWAAECGLSMTGELPELTQFVKHGDVLSWAGTEIHVIHTPGHTPGGVCYYVPVAKLVFTGDTLFAGCVGRADLPGGDYEQELLSVRNLLQALPDETQVLPGHGPSSTIADEKHNPYL